MGKLGKNDPCWCGSGRKFRKCHYPRTAPREVSEDILEKYGPFGLSPLMQSIDQKPAKDTSALLAKIISDKKEGRRSLPSQSLTSIGSIPTPEERSFLVDTCARIVDQNWCGRSEMCVYFAVLIRHGLSLLDYSATVEVGKATYSMVGNSYELDHAWVRTESGDIIDGNADSLAENPFVPKAIKPRPYWGPADQITSDRTFKREREIPLERDEVELEAGQIREWKRELEREVVELKKGDK